MEDNKKELIKLGAKIKSLREGLGLTQDELGKEVGYTSRSSINKVENGDVDLPRSKIIAFAKALKTTPAYLMGWEEPEEVIVEDEPEVPGVIAAHFDGDMTEDDVNAINTYIEVYLANKNKGKE